MQSSHRNRSPITKPIELIQRLKLRTSLEQHIALDCPWEPSPSVICYMSTSRDTEDEVKFFEGSLSRKRSERLESMKGGGVRT